MFRRMAKILHNHWEPRKWNRCHLIAFSAAIVHRTTQAFICKFQLLQTVWCLHHTSMPTWRWSASIFGYNLLRWCQKIENKIQKKTDFFGRSFRIIFGGPGGNSNPRLWEKESEGRPPILVIFWQVKLQITRQLCTKLEFRNYYR